MPCCHSIPKLIQNSIAIYNLKQTKDKIEVDFQEFYTITLIYGVFENYHKVDTKQLFKDFQRNVLCP